MTLLDSWGAPIGGAATESRPSLCRGCGCTDDNACVVRGVPCCWILLDVDTPTGICSACAARARWDQDFIVSYWHPDVVAALEGRAA